MNWRHFQTFLWLRWRIRVNQFKRAGVANAVIYILLAPFVVMLPVVLCVAAFLVGSFLLPEAPPVVVVLVWDALALFCLFWWIIGLFAELQRSEVLSLTKFLHLPVSLKGVFLVNYLSSLINFNVLFFFPAMLGLGLGMIFGLSIAALVTFLLVPAFFFMTTALTFQFQGWLAALMANKRRRRTIIVVTTMAFVLVLQLPNLLNVIRPWDDQEKPAGLTHVETKDEIARSYAQGKITWEEQLQRLRELDKDKRQEADEESWRQVEQMAWVANIVLPMGWLPLGAWAAAEGNWLPGLLGGAGMALIGAASLWRSYRTTVRLYTGQFTSAKGKDSPATPRAPASPLSPLSPPSPAKPAVFLERNIPWLSEQASAVALASFRGLMRAPEAKMMLLTPLIMVVVFGGMFFSRTINMPQPFRPILAFGGMGMVILGMGQIMGNQFGFDRGGFRVFVLCDASRRDILLGKNLAFVPLALGLAFLAVLFVQVVHPMRFDDFLACGPQALSMFLIYCLMTNLLSLYAPMPIASGSMKPANPKLVPILLQMLFLFCTPILQAPLLLPLAAQLLGDWLDLAKGWPICLVLSVLQCAVVILIYRYALTWQGSMLQASERKILEVVTTKAE